MADFYASFSTCMQIDHLPSSLFMDVPAALGAMKLLQSIVASNGPDLTVADAIAAGLLSEEFFAFAATFTVGGLLGACIGCALLGGVTQDQFASSGIDTSNYA